MFANKPKHDEYKYLNNTNTDLLKDDILNDKQINSLNVCMCRNHMEV